MKGEFVKTNSPSVAEDKMKSVSLYQLNNAGFVARTAESLWLVDALHDGAKQYGGISPEALTLIRRLAVGINEPVKLLVTHLHPDHLSARAVRSFAAEMPLTVYTADPEIEEMNLGQAQVALLPLDEHVSVGADRVRAIPLPHLSPQRFNILHTALRLDLGRASLFVSGDGLMDGHIFQRHEALIKGVDAAVCLYSYAFTRHNLAFTKQYIDPKILVVNHFPAPERDEYDSINRFRAFSAKNNEGMRIIPFAQVGDRLDV
jgi:glyoxylase-like metal-dependent hydrolase (beta-lactamase superfamily II)